MPSIKNRKSLQTKFRETLSISQCIDEIKPRNKFSPTLKKDEGAAYFTEQQIIKPRKVESGNVIMKNTLKPEVIHHNIIHPEP